MGEVVFGDWPRKGRKQASVYCIEGERVDMTQIAARLGISKAAASMRMNKLKNKPGAVTWERLRKVGR